MCFVRTDRGPLIPYLKACVTNILLSMDDKKKWNQSLRVNVMSFPFLPFAPCLWFIRGRVRCLKSYYSIVSSTQCAVVKDPPHVHNKSCIANAFNGSLFSKNKIKKWSKDAIKISRWYKVYPVGFCSLWCNPITAVVVHMLYPCAHILL